MMDYMNAAECDTVPWTFCPSRRYMCDIESCTEKEVTSVYTYHTDGENICPTTFGEKVVHVCEGNFASGTSVYLDTFKAVNYEGGCICQLRAQGGAVDLQVSVQGVHAACDATLYFAPPIDHTYNCADKTPTTTTGRIESGQSVFLSLTKSSDVADFCVNLVQTSIGGSLNIACIKGTLKPASTTTIAPAPAVTTSPTTIIENACLSESGDKGAKASTTPIDITSTVTTRDNTQTTMGFNTGSTGGRSPVSTSSQFPAGVFVGGVAVGVVIVILIGLAVYVFVVRRRYDLTVKKQGDAPASIEHPTYSGLSAGADVNNYDIIEQTSKFKGETAHEVAATQDYQNL